MNENNREFYKIDLTLERIENKIIEMENIIKNIELTVKGSIDYNDLYVPVSKAKLEKLKLSVEDLFIIEANE
jgi:hypothetical protein